MGHNDAGIGWGNEGPVEAGVPKETQGGPGARV